MFAPDIKQIAESLYATENGVILCQSEARYHAGHRASDHCFSF